MHPIRLAALLTLTAFQCAPAQDPSDPIASWSIEVDFGKDLGQSFGSLFEVRNKKGRVVAGAGFPDTYNTRFRTGRHMLQFFLRPLAGEETFHIERLPHPDLDTGVYLCDYEGSVYAWTSVRGNAVRRWDEKTRKWIAELPPGMKRMASGDGVMRIGHGRLTFYNSQAWYNDRQILPAPDAGRYYCFYYAGGHLFYYHMAQTDSQSFTKILACPWTPGEESIDISSAKTITAKYERETPFSWGQYNGQVLTVSNMGGIYVFAEGKWQNILESNDAVSYQVYSALHWQDRLLLAQYPTGNVFEYRGRKAVRLEGWPPVLPGVSNRARECQTLGIYGGDLLAGVWPWAELWRYDGDAATWHSMGRAFTHPELTAKQTHPYEADADRHGLVTNHWGQRITSMVPQQDALFLSTSTKGTDEWKSDYKFLTELQRREYGAVLRLRMPGNLAVQMKWKDGPTKLDFIINGKEILIRQDGETLGRSALPPKYGNAVRNGALAWKKGVYGPLHGSIDVRREVSRRPSSP